MDSEAQLRDRFASEGLVQALRGARNYTVFVLSMIAASALYSWMSEPLAVPQAVLLRVAGGLACGVVLYLLSTDFGSRHPRALTVLLITSITVMVHELARLSGGQLSAQYDRMSLVLLGTAMLMTWNAGWAACAGAAVLAVFLSGSAATGGFGSTPFIANLGRLLSACVVSVGAAFWRERRRWRDLRQTYEVTLRQQRAEQEITRLGAEARAAEWALERQEALAHAQRIGTMGEMAAQIAHEIHQPLTAMVNYANGLRTRLQTRGADDDLLDAVDRISAEGLRAGEILRRVRNFIRRGELSREPTSLNHLVSEAVRLVEPEARQFGISVQLQLEPSLTPLALDKVQIQQVIVNLLQNAIDSMSAARGGDRVLGIETARVDGRIEVRVRDTGSGLDPQVAGRIFDAFVTTKADGLGMGLSISRSIVEAHDGRLSAQTNQERGMTFIVSLPESPSGAAAEAVYDKLRSAV